MFRRALLSLALLLPTCAAFGADMAVKAPYRPVVAACNWCGFYLGIHVGYGWSRDGFSNPLVLDEFQFGDLNPSGVGFGGQVGYLSQWGMLVAGAEVDGTWWNLRKSAAVTVGGETLIDVTSAIKLDYTASVRAIVGLEIAPAFLIYATGGPAFGHATGTFNVEGVALEADATHFGWRAGGGIRTKYSENVILGIEGLWTDLGKASYAFGSGIDLDGHLQTGEIRARLDLRLN